MRLRSESETDVPTAAADRRGRVARLTSLGERDDVDVAERDADPRGWRLVAGDGEVVGRVTDLIVDMDALKVRYLDCELDTGRSETGGHRLIPVGFARLDTQEEAVIVDALTSDKLDRQLPVYAGPPIGREFEDRIRRAFIDGFGEGGGTHPQKPESAADRRTVDPGGGARS